MKRLGLRGDEVALVTVSAVLLLAVAWLSLPLSTPPGGGASADYVTATHAFDDAVAAGDPGKTADWVTGNALIELRAQIASDAQEALIIKTTRSPTKFELLAGSEGARLVQVRESGVQHLDIAQAPGSAVIATRERIYVRVVSLTRGGGHYQLSNLSESSAPAGWLDQWASLLIRAVLVVPAVALAFAAVMRRWRGPRPVELPGGPAEIPVVDTSAPADLVSERRIRCFGGLAINDHGQDLTQALLARRVVAFMWVYLLALEILRPGSRTTRAALADEVFPGLPSQTQRERLRDRLRDIREALPEPLANCIVQTNDAVGFDPTGWAIDAVELRKVAQAARSKPRHDHPEIGSGLENRWSGTLLHEWEDLERVTEGRDASHELIADLRVAMEAELVDLCAVAAAELLLVGDAVAAVRIAERAAALRGDREDVLRVLARAYAQTGHHKAAEDVET